MSPADSSEVDEAPGTDMDFKEGVEALFKGLVEELVLTGPLPDSHPAKALQQQGRRQAPGMAWQKRPPVLSVWARHREAGRGVGGLFCCEFHFSGRHGAEN